MPRTSVAVGVQIGSATVTTAFSKEGFRSAIQGLLCQHRWRLAESRMALCCKRCGARISSEMEKRRERPWQTGSSAATL
jgi:hypothetical protein